MRALLARFREPSTYAALAAGFAALGVTIPNETLSAVAMAGVGLSTLAGIAIPEGRAE